MDETRINGLVERHLEYARKIARGIARDLPPSVDFEDLEAFGRLGLVEAAGRWDPTAGSSFTTFAWYRIRGAVFDGLSRMTGLTPAVRARLARAEKEDAIVEESLRSGECASGPEELATGLTRAIRGIALVYLASQVGSGELDEGELVDEITPGEQAERHEALERLAREMETLDERQAEIIRMLYHEDRSISEVARRLGVNKSTVSRTHARILDDLRGRLESREQGIGSSIAREC